MTTCEHSTHKAETLSGGGKAGEHESGCEAGKHEGGSEVPIPSDNGHRPYPNALFHFGPYLNDATKKSCRLVCRDWRDSVDAYPASYKQLPYFYRLDIRGVYYRQAQNVKSWTDVAAFKHCCKNELKPIADAMAGKLLDPSIYAQQLFAMTLQKNYHTTLVELRILNRFTAETAFHFLHMLKHLEGCAIDLILMVPGAHSLIFAGLPSTVRCRQLSVGPILNWDDFSDAFEFFRTRNVSSTFPDVGLYIGRWKAAWPMARFNLGEAIASEERGNYGKFVFHNEQTGELYRVKVEVIEGLVRWVVFGFEDY